ncbi:hypothetical protein [Hymenobacter cellulosilyticus]|uniref:Uncharacterized protein n=1 Tax=Hymenobacter cellulosilyticus TaxID=2932248 RepID=A0A8T9QGJ2_9BACT|nr:hypothetical protein [Hymenobacter cellulosilyticus]UOQ75268.1 hypothetical protein MUN79_29190 [Hymenobacter cellulosilyticus]
MARHQRQVPHQPEGDFHHDSAEQGAGQVQQLRERVDHINQTQQDGPSLAVEVQRSTEQATIVRLTVARADTAQLEVVAQELYRQREQLRPGAERQQESFLRVDYPLAKDFNKELEYTNQGLNAEQIRAAAQREEQQRESERQQRPPKPSASGSSGPSSARPNGSGRTPRTRSRIASGTTRVLTRLCLEPP